MWLACFLAIGLPSLTLFIRVVVVGYKVGDPPSLILFLLPVVVCAYLGGVWPGLLATFLGAVLTDYFLLPPVHSMGIATRITFAQWITQLVTGILISVLTESLHRSRVRSTLAHVEQLVTLSSIGDAVITGNAMGRVTFLNPEAERLTGWSVADALGQELAVVFRIVNEETGKTVEDPMHKVIRVGSVAALPSHTILLSRDGRKVPVEDSSAPIRAADGTLQGIVLVFRDATEGRRAEKALQDQLALRNQLASIAETAPGVIYSFRLRADGSSCMPYSSGRILDIFGIAPEELAKDASHAFARMLPEDESHVQASIAESAREMKPWRDEFRVEHPQRGEIWVEGYSTPQGEDDGSILWQGFLSDVTERRKAEDLLRHSDRQMRLVTDGMPGLVAYVDSEYRYRFVNKKYQEWFGRPQWEIVGRSLQEVMGADGLAVLKDQLDRVLSGQTTTFETARSSVATGERIMQATYVPDIDATGRVNGFYALVLDITDRKKTEHDLREKDRVLREAMQAAHLVAWESDVATGTLKEEGPVMDMFFRTTSRTPSVEEWIEDIHPEDRGMVQGCLQAALEQGKEYHVEFRTRLGPDGSPHWVRALGAVERDDSGQPLRVRGIAMDVTKSKAAEEALRHSESQLKTALEAGRMGTWVSDVRKDRVWMDATAKELWGLPAGNAELTGNELRAMLHPDDVQRIQTLRQNLFHQGTDLSTEFRLLRQDGAVVWLASRARLERDASGAPLRQVGILMDITERKRGEEARVRSQKLEALGTLSGGIAHDFNNILLAINENARLVAEELPGDHSSQEGLAEIRKAGRRAADLVRQILAFSRPGQKEKQVQPLAPVVEEALKLVRATIPANIRFEIEIAGDLPLVAADSGQIYQIIVNLATNSAYAIGSKPGLIAITMEPFHAPSRVNTVLGLETGAYLMLTVRDNGSGMDMATLDRIFDPFFTTKPQGQGSGLGLSMVHGIMKNHGGAIAVSSELGKGTAFQLYFPASLAPVAKTDPQQAPGAPLGELRVLYVDDEESLVSLAGRALRRMGYKVAGFTDPREALQAFQKAPDDFDIVVTDLSMPHLSGFDLARQLMAIRPEMPVVLISGYVRPVDEEMAAQLGVQKVLLKPSSIEEIGRSLDAIFREKRQTSHAGRAK